MPVEINEMVIKGTVGSTQSEPEKAKPQKEDAAGEKTLGKLSYALRRQIVQECVQEVMDKINLSRER
jgi:hypothetical protein